MRRFLFVCLGNSCRSQMAEGFARHYGRGKAEVESAGTTPAGYVHPLAIKVMHEKGIDISRQKSKPLDIKHARGAKVIIMGCNVSDTCPASVLKEAEDWGIEDPIGRPIGFYRKVRDEIEKKVRKLLGGPEPK